MKIALFSSDKSAFSKVYSENVLEKLRKQGETSERIDKSNINENKEFLSRCEVAFATWGMVKFTEEEIKEYMPNLKALFYSAGSVQYFAEPFLNCGIRVFSAFAVEVGSSTSKTVSTSYTNGSYPYGYALDGDGNPDLTGSDKDKATAVSSGTGTGVTLTKMAINYNGSEVDSTTSSSLSVSVDSGVETTRTAKSVTATAQHSAGNVPVSILKNKYPSKKIATYTLDTTDNGKNTDNNRAEKTNTNDYPSFRWYEPVFSGFKYEGALIAEPEAITATEIKALGVTVKDANAYNKTPITNAKATDSWRQYFIAVPVNYGKELTKIVDTTNQPLAFKKKAQNVSVTLGTAPVEYEVFYVSFPSAFDTVEFNLSW